MSLRIFKERRRANQHRRQRKKLRLSLARIVSAWLVTASSIVHAAPGDILFQEEFNNNGDFSSDWTSFGFGSAFVSTATFSSSPRALQIGSFPITVTSRSGRIDTSGIAGADLNLWIRRGANSFSDYPEAGDNLILQYRNNLGVWTTLDTYLGGGTAGEILTPTFSLPADALYSTLQIRFWYTGFFFWFFDYWHIDDVVVTETGPVGTCGTYRDEFNSNTYNNSDGTLSWTSDFWSETNDDASPTSGLVSISSGRLELSGNGTASNTAITRQLDTAGSTALTLSFDFQMLGGVDPADSATVEISDNGGSSWTTLETFTGFSNNDSGSRSYDITAYAAANMQIRFAISPDSGGDCCYDDGGERIEIDNLEINTCNTATTDHFAIFHSGTGVTCEAEVITITAHDSSDNGVDVGGNTIQITATSASPGWSTADTSWGLGAGTGTFSTPSAGVAQYQFGSSETSVVLEFANTSLADIDFDVVDTGDPSLTDDEGSAEDPLLSFTNTALRFYNDADGNGDRDGTDPIASPLTSGITSGQWIVRAVETNTHTGACEARATGTHTVNMGYQCVNPIYCFRSADADINGSPIGENDFGGTSNLTGISLTFDADGEAPFNFEYYDAGGVRLYSELPLTASGSDPAITLTGTSNTTIVRPADIVITQVTDSGGTANPGTTATGSGFTTAGSPFTVVIEGRNADGDITPNFGAETVNEGVVLVEQALVMPAGGNLAALSAASAFSSTGTAGQFQNTTVNWNQVGTLTMRAEIADGDYLSTGNVTGTTSGNIGRFYPASFDLGAHTVTPECVPGNFSYMSDQSFIHRPLDIAYAVLARSALSTVVSNYDDTLGYPTRAFNAVAENANDGTDLGGRVSILGSTWNSGAYAVSAANNGGFARALSGINEVVDGPYNSLQLGLVPNSDGPDSIDFLGTDLTMNASQSNDCVVDGDCDAAAIGTPLSLVFGRLWGRNAHGPETNALSVPLAIQQWDGSEFVINANDDCTDIAASATQFDGSSIDIDANRTVTVGGGTSTGTFASLTAGVAFTFVDGESGLSFSAPGSGNLGNFDVDIDLTNYPWLRSDWDNDGDSADDTALPSLDINFGRYRGHDRVIFWREDLD